MALPVDQAVAVRWAGFRYHPAVGGAEQHGRRMLREIGARIGLDVLTVVTENRTDWLRLLIDGLRDQDDCYQVDGRPVRALARWPEPVRRKLWALAPFYHLPFSPAPTLMGRIMAPHLDRAIQGARLLHNVFMGREAFSMALLLSARRRSIPFVFTPLVHHRPLGWNSPAFLELYRRADALIALTHDEADWLLAHGANPQGTHVIGIGPLSDPSASPLSARRRVGGGRIVLFLGQVHRYKGYQQVLKAAHLLRSLPDVKFVFAGPAVRGHDAAFRDAPENVLYLSTVDDAMRDSLLQACTVLCVPSSRESFGGALVDAWACGKPVIGGPAAATRELVEDGLDGWVVPQDPAAVADRLRRILESEELARRMGEAGRQKVQQRFSWSAIAAAHLEIYTGLLAPGARG